MAYIDLRSPRREVGVSLDHPVAQPVQSLREVDVAYQQDVHDEDQATIQGNRINLANFSIV
jgi:hypothetical protein